MTTFFCQRELDFSQITTAIMSTFAACCRELKGLNHSIGNFLPIGNQCFTNHNLPLALGNLPIAANGLSLVPIGNDMWVRAHDNRTE